MVGQNFKNNETMSNLVKFASCIVVKLQEDLCSIHRKPNQQIKHIVIAEPYEKSFSKSGTIINYSRLPVKKLLIEPTSADKESRLAITMAHNFVGGEGASS